MMEKKEILFVVLGIVAAICGLLSVLFVPNFAHNTYISDNSLLPGVATITFNRMDMQFASDVTRNYISRQNVSSRHEYVLEEMSKIGLETYSVDDKLVWGILRARSAEGKESVALATHTTADTLTLEQFDKIANDQQHSGVPFSEGLGITLAIAKHLSEANWLAKDFVFVISMREKGIEDWTENYVTREARAGALQTALVLDVSPTPNSAFIDVRMHGCDGQLPNLDMFNSFIIIADRNSGSNTVSMSCGGFPDNAVTRFFSDTVYPLAQKLLLDPVFHGSKYSFQSYCSELADLAHFIWLQARGVPNGDHAFFTQYRIDSITIGMSNFSYRSSAQTKRVSQLDVAKSTVSLLRSLNNLLTHMHRSFYIYLLSGPNLYTSVAEYSLIIGLLVGAILIFAVAHIYVSPPSIQSALFGIAELLWFSCVAGVVYICGVQTLSQGIDGAGFFTIIFAITSVISIVVPVIIQHKYPEKTRSEFPVVLVAISLFPSIIYLGTTYLTNFSFCAVTAAVMLIPAFLHCRIPLNLRIIRFVLALAYSVPALIVYTSLASGMSWKTLIINIFQEGQHYGAPLSFFLLLFYLPFSLISIRLVFAPRIAAPTKQKKD